MKRILAAFLVLLALCIPGLAQYTKFIPLLTPPNGSNLNPLSINNANQILATFDNASGQRKLIFAGTKGSPMSPSLWIPVPSHYFLRDLITLEISTAERSGWLAGPALTKRLPNAIRRDRCATSGSGRIGNGHNRYQRQRRNGGVLLRSQYRPRRS